MNSFYNILLKILSINLVEIYSKNQKIKKYLKMFVFRILIHCYGGLGRTCLVAACFLMYLDPNLLPDTVISYLRLDL